MTLYQGRCNCHNPRGSACALYPSTCRIIFRGTRLFFSSSDDYNHRLAFSFGPVIFLPHASLHNICFYDIFQSLLTLLWRGCPTTLVCLDVKVNLKMPRLKSKAASEVNDSILQNEFGFGKLTTAKIFGAFAEELDRCFDRNTSHFDQPFEESKEKNKNNQRLAALQHEAQHPRLAAKSDVNLDMTTRERMKGAAADDEKYRDISSAWVDDDPMRLTSFRNQESTETSALSKKSDDALVDEGAKAPKSRLSLVTMRKSTPAGGSLDAGSAST